MTRTRFGEYAAEDEEIFPSLKPPLRTQTPAPTTSSSTTTATSMPGVHRGTTTTDDGSQSKLLRLDNDEDDNDDTTTHSMELISTSSSHHQRHDQYSTSTMDHDNDDTTSSQDGNAEQQQQQLLPGQISPRRRSSVISTLIHGGGTATSSSVRDFQCYGIHSWVFVSISSRKPHGGDIKGIVIALLFSISWLVVSSQYAVFLFINAESTYPPCDGVYYNCSTEGQICVDREQADGALLCGDCSASYCNPDCTEGYCQAYGIAPGTCPYIEKNRPSPAPGIVIVIILFLVASVVVQDMDQNCAETRAAQRNLEKYYHQNRDSNNPGLRDGEEARRRLVWKKWFTVLNLTCLNIMRAYFIPTLSFSGLIAILYKEKITATNVLLNGLAIVLVGELDDILSMFFLHPDIQSSVNEQIMEANIEELMEKSSRKQQFRIVWWMHRVHCMALMMVSAWVIFAPISAIEFAQLFVNYETCHAFYTACFIPALASVPFIFIDKIIEGSPFRLALIHGIGVLIFVAAIQALFMSIFWAIYFQTNFTTLWSWV